MNPFSNVQQIIKSCIKISVLCSLLLVPSVDAQPIDIKNLKTISVDSLGTLDQSNGGFSSNLWQNTSGNTIALLLQSIRSRNNSPIMQSLLARLLLTSGHMPWLEPKEDSPTFFEYKLKYLLELRKLSEVRQLITQVPTSSITGAYRKIYVDSLFLEARYKEACDYIRDYTLQENEPFWQKTNLFCLAFEKKLNEVELGLSLMEETQTDTQLSCCKSTFDELILTIASEETEDSFLSTLFGKKEFDPEFFASNGTITPFEFALLDMANVPFVENTLKNASPALLSAIALHSGSPLPIRIHAAELAVLFNALNIEALANLYNQHRWEGSVDEALTNTILPLQRAAYFQAVSQAEISLAMLENAFKAYKNHGLKNLSYMLFIPQVIDAFPTNKDNERSRLNLAKTAISALIVNGYFEGANKWYRLLENYGLRDESIGKIVDMVRPLVRGTIPNQTTWKPEYASNWWENYIFNVQAKNDLAMRLFTVVQSYEHKITSALWEKIFINENSQNKNNNLISTPQHFAFEQMVLHTAAEQKIGLSILSILYAIGPGGPALAPLDSLYTSITALRKLGLEQEARMLSLEAIIYYTHPNEFGY